MPSRRKRLKGTGRKPSQHVRASHTNELKLEAINHSRDAKDIDAAAETVFVGLPDEEEARASKNKLIYEWAKHHEMIEAVCIHAASRGKIRSSGTATVLPQHVEHELVRCVDMLLVWWQWY